MRAESSIWGTLVDYVRVHDSRDVDGYVALFVADGVLVRGEAYRGHQAIRAFISSHYSSQPTDRQTRHLCANAIIDVRGTQATAETDFVTYERFADQPWQVNTVGRYVDRLVRQRDRWLFLERKIASA